jgi:putative colanic acid biosynthesis acetyltransferase WcaF
MRSHATSEYSSRVDLTLTHGGGYHPGKPFPVRALWLLVETITLLNPVVVSYPLKRWVLRRFGAEIGVGVLIKPGVHVKYPWRLRIGNFAWIGERAWIDNMEDVSIGAHAVVSQGAYLVTGNHDWSDPGMPLAPRALAIEQGAWVGAGATVGPGSRLATDAVLTLGSVLVGTTEAACVYTGVPAVRVGVRSVTEPPR